MSFIPLKTDKNTPTRVGDFIKLSIKIQFEDIHAMLRLPIPSNGILAGLNFAAANSLFSLISGLSALGEKNLDASGQGGVKFKGILENYYPWDVQPAEGDVTPHGIKGTADQLYKYFRNPLAHSLGVKHKGNYQVVLNKSPLSEQKIEELENATSSPGSAISYSPIVLNGETVERITLNIPNFYWGIREMLYRVTADAAFMRKAETNLAALGL